MGNYLVGISELNLLLVIDVYSIFSDNLNKDEYFATLIA